MAVDVIEIKKASPDSQFRLVPCKGCKGENVAYVRYSSRGREAWRVECFDCGRVTDKRTSVRHEAQLAWNREEEL